MRQWHNRFRSSKLLLAIMSCSIITAILQAEASGQSRQISQQPAAAQNQTSPAPDQAAQNYFPDVELVNQDGQTMRLYSDVLKGHVVVINCFFATCTGSCPVMSGKFEKLQSAFSDTLGKRLLLVSITVDPVTDTPQQLKVYAQRFHAQSGRVFLTGKKENVELALKKLGFYVENKNDHVNIFVVGNVPTGLWKKAFGLAKPEDLIAVVQSVIDDKGK
jgi:protein SCO1/2